jgi:hypothetical protein
VQRGRKSSTEKLTPSLIAMNTEETSGKQVITAITPEMQLN